ncbi:MAG: OmpH family outer membrane protein [Bacteroidota bacterium]
MKKYFYLPILLLALALTSTVKAQTGDKIGFTNIELLLAYLPESKTIDKQMQTMEAKLKESLEVKQKYYQQKMMTYVEREQKGPPMGEAEKQAAVAEIQKLEGEIQKDIESGQNRILKRRMELLKPIQDKIQKAIDEVATEGGYSYILNQAVGSGIPSILYGDKQYDVTEAIAKKLGIDVENEGQ